MIKIRGVVVLLALALATYLVYAPGLTGYFQFDDYINVVGNARLMVTELDFESLRSAAYSGGAGMLGRPLSMLTFALDYYAHGMNPYYFKLTNIVIHIANGLLVFGLSKALLSALRTNRAVGEFSPMRAYWISVAVAAAWMLHPLNMTSVLYIVQRMNSLGTFFTIAGLIAFTVGRLRLQRDNYGWIPIAACFLVFLPLAALSKENGALLPLFALLIELVFFRLTTANASSRKLLIVLLGATAVLPVIAASLYAVLRPEWLGDTYVMRGFTMSERLITEARILWFYLRLAVAPDITALGMYHDDIALSTGLLEPITGLFACIGIVGAAIFALFSVKSRPVAAFGILFFLVGHSMESSILPLELVHEHRNYLPLFGPLFALFYYLFAPSKHNESMRIRTLIGATVVVALGAITLLRANTWGDAAEMRLKDVEHHPDSARSNIEAAAFFSALPATNPGDAEEYYRKAYQFYVQASSLSKRDTLGLFGLIALNARNNLPIEDSWTTALAGRLEHYPLLPNTTNALGYLLKCEVDGPCASAAPATETLFGATLRNPTVLGGQRVDVLFMQADYLIKIKHQAAAGVAVSYQAAALAPNDVEQQMSLALDLINAGRKNEALNVLDLCNKIDKMNAHAGQIRYLRNVARKIQPN